VSRKKLTHFLPTNEHPNYKGVNGWGFKKDGYLVVVYGPNGSNHEQPTHDLTHSKMQIHDQQLEQSEAGAHPDKLLRRYAKSRKKDKSDEHNNGKHEHGPAHVHVIRLGSNRETRFELVEHYRTGEHAVRMMHNGVRREPLTANETKAVEQMLPEHVGDLIQTWRELHQDSKLSSYVNRIVPNSRRKGPDGIQRIDSEGWLETSYPNGNQTMEPPPNAILADVRPPIRTKRR
jgi:hypothetical protein